MPRPTGRPADPCQDHDGLDSIEYGGPDTPLWAFEPFTKQGLYCVSQRNPPRYPSA